MTKRNLCSKPHYWPEAIDIDGDGNLYFSDVVAKKLYCFTRGTDGSLQKQEQLLLQGFKHAAGISIDRGKELLYLGVTLRDDQVSKVLQIPLGLLDRVQEFEYSYEKLKTESSEFLELKSNFQETAAELSSKSAEVETLRKELSDLEMNRSIIWFVAGASVFLIGFLLGLSARRQRRKSPLR